MHLALAALAGAAVLVSIALLATSADASGATTHWEALSGDLSVGRAAAIALGGLCLASIVTGIRTLIRQVRRTRRALASLHHCGHHDDAVVFIESRPVAFCAGLRRPQVFLSSGAIETLEPAALAAVVEHERHHARRRDPLRLLVVQMLSDALFIAPALSPLADRYGTALELRADAIAVRASGGDCVPLARALLTFDGRPDSGVDPARVDHLLGTLDHRALPAAAIATSVLAAVGLLLATLSAVELGGVLEFCLPLAQHACFVLLDLAPLVIGAAAIVRFRDLLAARRS